MTLTENHIRMLMTRLQRCHLEGDLILLISTSRHKEAFELGLAPFCPLSPLCPRAFIAIYPPEGWK